MKTTIKHIQFSCTALLLAAGLFACGGGGGGGGGGSNSGGAEEPEQVATDMSNVAVVMTLAERNAGLGKVSAALSQYSAGNLDTDNANLAAYIRTLPEFADAGVGPDQTVWARYKDGRPVVFFSYRRINETPVAPQSASMGEKLVARLSDTGNMPAVAMQNAATKIAPNAFDIPQTGVAILIDAGGIGRGGPAAVAPWLTKAGYSPVLAGSTINDLIAVVKNADILYFATHGMFSTAKNGKRVYIIGSTDQFKLETSAQLTSDELLRESLFTNGLLVQTVYQHSDGTTGYYWAITEDFVKTYWSFKKDSLIIIDACSLFDASTAGRAAVGASFRSALQSKSANATTVVGWSHEVGAGFAADTIKLFFDRVLGENVISPESPLQRPFTYKEIHGWMVSNGKDVDPNNALAKLSMDYLGTTNGQLTPAIMHINVLHPASGADYGLSSTHWILELSGTFGPDPGAEGVITINDQPLTIIPGKWTENSMMAEYNPDGPNSTGPVVLSVRGHKSNPVPITKWSGTIVQDMSNFNSLDAAAHIRISCTAVGAGDVHANRDQPGGAIGRGNSILLRVIDPCTYVLSGSWSTATDTYDLSGSGQLEALNSFGVDKIAGSLTSATNRSAALPAQWMSNFGGVFDNGTGTGVLKITDKTSGDVTEQPQRAGWLPSIGSITLGADFGFSGQVNCSALAEGPCTETWNLTPQNAPATDTES